MTDNRGVTPRSLPAYADNIKRMPDMLYVCVCIIAIYHAILKSTFDSKTVFRTKYF